MRHLQTTSLCYMKLTFSTWNTVHGTGLGELFRQEHGIFGERSISGSVLRLLGIYKIIGYCTFFCSGGLRWIPIKFNSLCLSEWEASLDTHWSTQYYFWVWPQYKTVFTLWIHLPRPTLFFLQLHMFFLVHRGFFTRQNSWSPKTLF